MILIRQIKHKTIIIKKGGGDGIVVQRLVIYQILIHTYDLFPLYFSPTKITRLGRRVICF